jgi:hypothetical protein
MGIKLKSAIDGLCVRFQVATIATDAAEAGAHRHDIARRVHVRLQNYAHVANDGHEQVLIPTRRSELEADRQRSLDTDPRLPGTYRAPMRQVTRYEQLAVHACEGRLALF